MRRAAEPGVGLAIAVWTGRVFGFDLATFSIDTQVFSNAIDMSVATVEIASRRERRSLISMG